MKRTYTRYTCIKCIETDKIYNTVAEAAREMDISLNVLYGVLNGKYETCGGYHFEVVDGIEPKEITIQHKAVVRGKGKSYNGNTNAVLCISTGDILTSTRDAANYADVTPGFMSNVCRGNSASAKGKRYCYVKDITEHLDEVAESIRKANMYDEFTTKKEKHQQLLGALHEAESKVSLIEDNIQRLHEQLKQAHLEVEKAKHDIMHFEW